MQKILHIIPTLDRSGAEKQMVLLASHLPKDAFDVHVAVLTRSGPLAEELMQNGVPFTLIGKRHKIDFSAYYRLKRLIRHFKPDIVHTWLFAGNSYGRQAALACGVKRIIAGERCVDPWKSRLQLTIDRHLAKRTDNIVTNSNGVKDFYVSKGIAPEKFVIIPNAAQTAVDFSAVCRLPSAVCAALQQTPFQIGIVARLWPQKRLLDALWVFHSLQFAKINFHAMIIGDGPEREMLLRYRDNWQLQERVHFLGHRNDVLRLMPTFDLMLSFSAYEGQSNSILEAMSCGIPVIATDIPGNADLVVSGKTGILVPDSGDDFRQRRRLFIGEILRLLEDEPLRKQMGKAAQERVTEHFSLTAMIRRHAELYGLTSGH